MKKKIDSIFIIIICLFVLVFLVGSFLLPDKEFSQNENRYLTQIPVFSFDDFFSGKYMETAENYLTDQMPLHDSLITLRTGIQRLLGFDDINGVYFAKNDTLIEKHLEQDFPYEQLAQNTETIQQFAKTHPNLNISMMMVPTSELILEELLPENAPSFAQAEILEQLKENLDLDSIQYINIRNALESHDDSYIYFKTDHHWTALGAFFAYEEWCKQNGLTAALSDYEVHAASDSFHGSLYSKVLNADCAYDSIEILLPKEELTYTVSYDFGKTVSESCYAPERLTEKDKYQVFLNGNHPEVTITTEQKNGKHLLILKDSFANAFIPYLIPHYESIHVLDLRYFNQDVKIYMQEKEITDVLFLYNIINFAEDKNFKKLLP